MNPHLAHVLRVTAVFALALMASVSSAFAAGPGVVCETSPWIEPHRDLVYIELDTEESEAQVTTSVLTLEETGHQFKHYVRGTLDQDGQGEFQIFAASPKYVPHALPVASLSIAIESLSDPVKKNYRQLVGTYQILIRDGKAVADGQKFRLRCTRKRG